MRSLPIGFIPGLMIFGPFASRFSGLLFLSLASIYELFILATTTILDTILYPNPEESLIILLSFTKKHGLVFPRIFKKGYLR